MIPEDHLEFLHAVWTRRATYTYVFFGLNIAVFLLMAFAGGSTNEQTLMAFGVKANSAIAQGQWWRFVTPVFIHIGWLHIIFNSYALWIVGPQVEKLYGSARFVILYVITGVAGVLGSYLFHPFSISAGASGAIFGLFGVLLVFGIRYRESIPPFFKRAVGTGVLPVIFINLFIGFTIPGIDNSAHIGGLLAGAVLAAVVPFQKPGAQTLPVFRTIQMGLLALIAICFFSVAKNYNGPHLSVSNLGRGLLPAIPTMTNGSSSQDFSEAINGARRSFVASTQALQTNQIDGLTALRADTARSLDRLRKIPSLSAASDFLAARLIRLLQNQYQLMQEVQASRTVTFGAGRRLQQNAAEYEKWSRDFSQWVQTEGSHFGIGFEMGKDR
jgi:membrane associated rhomboid family serine protease